MKKRYALLLAGIMVFTMLFVPGAIKEVVAEEETVVFNIYKNGSWPAFPSDGGTGHQLLLDAMEDYGITGVDFVVTHIGGTEYYDKLNALSAIDDLPDYFSINMTNLKNFADQDLLLPLEDHMDKLPIARPMMRQTDLDSLLYNGHLYALPVAYMEGAINGPNTTGLVIRQDWLDAVGMDMPTTLEELEAVMEAFKTQDPDGNGEDDTFAYIGNGTTHFNEIFGAFDVLPSFWMDNGEGGVQLGSTKPETVEALKLLADWYSKGYIDPDIFTNDMALQDQKLVNSKGGIYENSAFTLDPANPEHAALLAVNPDATLSPMPGVRGPNGDFGAYEAPPGYGNLNAVSYKVQDIDKLFAMLNWLTDAGEGGGMYLASVGIPGDHFELNEDETRINMLKSYDDIYADGLGNPIRFLQVVDRRWMTDEAANAFEVYNEKYRTNLFWGTTESMLTYPDTPSELFVRYMQKIVMGDLDAEEGFQQYLNDFEEMGGLQITEEVQAALNEAVSVE